MPLPTEALEAQRLVVQAAQDSLQAALPSLMDARSDVVTRQSTYDAAVAALALDPENEALQGDVAIALSNLNGAISVVADAEAALLAQRRVVATETATLAVLVLENSPPTVAGKYADLAIQIALGLAP